MSQVVPWPKPSDTHSVDKSDLCADAVGDVYDSVSVIIPTFKRPAGLQRALISVDNQNPCGIPIKIIVSDNDPDGGAEDIVKSFMQQSTHCVVYVHAPKPGVSNARNAALTIVESRYIAWLDDDQEAAPNWLESYLKISKMYAPAITFCPSHAVLETTSRFNAFFNDFFSREGPSKPCEITEIHGCGNSFMDTVQFSFPEPAFDPVANETGGEDDLLFTHLQDEGGTIAWTPDTHVKEYVPGWRSTPEYVKLRSFAYGQGPSRISANSNGFSLAGVAKWTLIGIIQVAVYAPLSLILRIISHPSSLRVECKAREGLGKIFWHETFRPKLYGQQAQKLKTKFGQKT
ncbi:MAG: glycosyltransferase family 2 protein [Litorimonas sp.]